MSVVGALLFLALIVVAMRALFGLDSSGIALQRTGGVLVLAAVLPLLIAIGGNVLPEMLGSTTMLSLLAIVLLSVVITGYVAFVNRTRRFRVWRQSPKTSIKRRVGNDD